MDENILKDNDAETVDSNYEIVNQDLSVQSLLVISQADSKYSTVCYQS